MPTIEDLKARLEEVDQEIEGLTCWGAYAAVLGEERRALIRSIGAKKQSRVFATSQTSALGQEADAINE